MVNFYSMGTGYYGNQAYGGNVHQALKNKYGVGYADFGTRPYEQPYPMPIIPRCKAPVNEEKGFWSLVKKFLF